MTTCFFTLCYRHWWQPRCWARWVGRYPEEFRRQAAALVLDSGRTIRDVGRELGVNHETLRNWVDRMRQERDGGRPGDRAVDERAELVRLRRQVAQLELEKEILKKPRSSSHARRRRPPTRSVCSAACSASATAPSTSGCASAGRAPLSENATTRHGPRSLSGLGRSTVVSTAPGGSPPSCMNAVTGGTARRRRPRPRCDQLLRAVGLGSRHGAVRAGRRRRAHVPLSSRGDARGLTTVQPRIQNCGLRSAGLGH